MRITAAIISFNEEKNIAAAIESVQWADEIIVVDSGSTDLTRSIAEGLGANVIERAWDGFSTQKQFAVDSAANDWIFSLDADERVSDILKTELLAIKASPPNAAGFTIPRLSYYMGRAIRHGGWYPDRQLRLFDRRKARWKSLPVHESVEMAAGAMTRRLNGDILHFSVESASHHHRMIGERYAPLAAQSMLDAGITTTPIKVGIAGPIAFFRTYILKGGLLDGFPGFCIAAFAAHHAFLKNLLLWEMLRARKTDGN